MKIAPAKIESFIDKPDLELIGVLLYGPDHGLANMRHLKLVNHVAKETDPFLVTEISPDKLKEDSSVLADELAAMSMLGDRRVVRIREASNSISKTIEAAISTVESVKKGLAWLVISAGDLDSKSTLRKLFESHPRLAAVPCYQDDERGLSSFISAKLREFGLIAKKEVVDLISSRCLGDRMLAVKALEKLEIYIGDSKEITFEDAENCIGDATESATDDLVYSIFLGKPELSVKHFDKCLAQGMNEIGILRACQSHCQKLLEGIAMLESGTPAEEVVKKQRIFWKKEAVYIQCIRKLKGATLWPILRRLTESEKECKMGIVDSQLLCGRTILEISSLIARL